MWTCWACQMMKLVYWVAVPATRQLHKSPACSWWRAARCSSPCSAALEVKHTADGSRMAGATVDSQIKHIHNEDKYWPRHRLKKRWDERREGQGNAGGLNYYYFFFLNQNLVRYSDQVELWSGTEREGADVTPRLTSKLTKQQSVVLLGAFLIPASALISLYAFEEDAAASFHAASPDTSVMECFSYRSWRETILNCVHIKQKIILCSCMHACVCVCMHVLWGL